MATARFDSGAGNTLKIEFPKIKNPQILQGFFSDPKTGKRIKEATYGQKVKFTIETQDVDDGTSLDLTLYDYDGQFNIDDKLSRTYSINIKSNKASLEFVPDKKWEKNAEYEIDGAVEAYFEIEAEIYGAEVTVGLPKSENDYLMLYPEEVKITVIVELPHSLETGWGAKGLAGHTAMAIGETYFDYGPNNRPGVYSESDYGVDFNDDGDETDNVSLTSPSFENAPGMPWWGTFIAAKKGIKPKDVTLKMALTHIGLHWRGTEIPAGSGNFPDATQIYGKVHTIEFYASEAAAEKMRDWWENRYDELEIYSVYPWTGEQCTTTAKTALQEGGIAIPDITQTPEGILADFKNLKLFSSVKHNGEKATITVIKPESADWTP